MEDMNIIDMLNNPDLLFLNKLVPKNCAECTYCRKEQTGSDYYDYVCTLGNNSIINNICKKPEWCYIAPVSLEEVMKAMEKKDNAKKKD